MFRWVILIQAIVYLLVMPYLRSASELGYYPPLLIGLLGIAALAAGCFAPGERHAAAVGQALSLRIVPRKHLWVAILLWAVVYAYTSVQFGLLNRRQGSEFMAELYANVPLWALAVLRSYEVLFVPIILLYAFSTSRDSPFQRLVVGLVLLASLPFMGIADSRGRLLVIAIYIICFVPAGTFIRYLTRNVRLYVGGALAFGAFFYYSFQRSGQYYSLKDYLLVDIYSRLDGLNIVTQLRDAKLLSYFGRYDIDMLGPLISKLPFLEAAKAAKLMGRTSSKQYYIQDLLKSSRLDDSNSMIADPMYFAGIFGVVLVFFLFGWAVRHFDRFVAEGRMFTNWTSTIAAITFVTSFAVFESDLVGAVAAAAQTGAILTVFMLLACKRQLGTRSPAAFHGWATQTGESTAPHPVG